MGLAELGSGELLNVAEAAFDVEVATDGTFDTRRMAGINRRS
jgi:hypothetical protein